MRANEVTGDGWGGGRSSRPMACGYTCQGGIERRAGVQAGWANHLWRCSVVADSLNS
jgi:hypothetical protein